MTKHTQEPKERRQQRTYKRIGHGDPNNVVAQAVKFFDYVEKSPHTGFGARIYRNGYTIYITVCSGIYVVDVGGICTKAEMSQAFKDARHVINDSEYYA